MKRGKPINPLRDLLIGHAYTLGYLVNEIADAMNVNPVTVCNARKRSGIEGRGQGRNEGPCTGRWQEITELFRSGMTLEAIGMKFNVTRERVRQILKIQGINGKDGGQTVSRVISSGAKREERRQYVEAKNMARFGCSYEKALQINGGLAGFQTAGCPTSAYLQQRQSAGLRGIGFKLTLEEWWDIWQASGKWDQRGRGNGKFCMSRVADAGAYELGNVEIITNNQNASDSYKVVSAQERAVKRGWVRDELGFTPGQRRVYDLVRAGLNNKAIAAQLDMDPRTVSQYKSRVLRTRPLVASNVF